MVKHNASITDNISNKIIYFDNDYGVLFIRKRIFKILYFLNEFLSVLLNTLLKHLFKEDCRVIKRAFTSLL